MKKSNLAEELTPPKTVTARLQNGDVVYTRFATQLDLVDCMQLLSEVMVGMLMYPNDVEEQLKRLERAIAYIDAERAKLIRIQNAEEAAIAIDPTYATNVTR